VPVKARNGGHIAGGANGDWEPLRDHLFGDLTFLYREIRRYTVDAFSGPIPRGNYGKQIRSAT
jgi:hypothetical protein